MSAHRHFRRLCRLLGQRWHGVLDAGPEWLRPEIVCSLQLVGDREVHVNLRDDFGGRGLPASWQGLRLRAMRAPPLQAQAAPPRLTLSRTGEDGTATALVRDRLNGRRCYLLTCGHVVAPDAATRFGDPVRVSLSPVTSVAGALREWQPAIGPGNAPSTMDAALVELDEGAQVQLATQPAEWLPRGVSRDTSAGRSVSLRRAGGPLDGSIVGPWAGAVTGPSAAIPEYFLQDAVGYRTDSLTLGGDSGAALWSEGDALLGMHIGAIADTSNTATAVMTRVVPALEWFCVKPFTRDDPATLGPGDWPPLPGRLAAKAARSEAAQQAPSDPDARDRVILAKTLWGEARGEGRRGMQAVAAVVMNRKRQGYRGRRSAAEVCLDPRQFSCWNGDDPNLPLLQRIDANPDADFVNAMQIARDALAGDLPDPTFGSKHYVATTLPPRAMPDWLLGKTPVVTIGRHAFYNDIL